ncbi:MAG: Ig-like domain-containing protein [Candidatus Lernaella stagnicola]|nr:Ig-like domain-containing protein [Candidatus Lernaella stagnicola]
MMRRFKLPALLAFLLLVTACEGDFVAPAYAPETEVGFGITYTYPPSDTAEFPITGSIIVHFNRNLNQATGAEFVDLRRTDSGGAAGRLPVDVFVDDGNMIITPIQPFDPHAHYHMRIFGDVRSMDDTPAELPENGFEFFFSTLGDRPLAGRPLAVETVLPDPSSTSVFDFHTFRVYFSEPVDRRTILNKETFLFADSEGNAVDGAIFVRATQMVFDPDEDLTPGRYRMTLTTGIQDVGGESLPTRRVFDFDVRSSGERKTLNVENCPTLGARSSCVAEISPDALPRHAFTGDDANSMLVDSLLLGPTRTYISGQLRTSLGDPGLTPEAIPILIRKGQRLYATSIESQLGGAIPTGLDTGEIVIHVLTDAVGLLHRADADTPIGKSPAAVSLTLDAAISPADTAAGMIMSQIILGTRLYGTASVDPGANHLVLEVAGFAEFFILGERIRTTMSLVMKDVETLLPDSPDNRPPELRMTYPRQGERRVRLGTAIQMVFDEPVSVPSSTAEVTLRIKDGPEVANDLLNNGPKLLLVPREPLEPYTTYEIVVGVGLADILGNETAVETVRKFTTGAIEWSSEPPIVGTSNPGRGTTPALFPGHFPIEVWFSQVMDADTIVLGDTFRVIDLYTGRDVPGTIVHFFQRVAFYPNEPLAPGTPYRLVLTSDITNYAGVRLDVGRDHIEPGDGNEQWTVDFTAAAANNWVPLRLMLSPVADVDGSGFIDNGETIPNPPANFFKVRNFLVPEPTYAAGYLMAYVKGLDYNAVGKPFLDIELSQGISLISTNTQIDLGGLLPSLGDDEIAQLAKDSLFDPLGRVFIDIPQPSFAPAMESPERRTEMNAVMNADISVDNDYFNAALDRVTTLNAVGELSFSPDGLMVVELDGRTTITMNLKIPLIGINIPIPLPTDLEMRGVSRNPLSWWNTF